MDPYYNRTNSNEYKVADEFTPDYLICDCGAILQRITGAAGREFHGYNCPNNNCDEY